MKLFVTTNQDERIKGYKDLVVMNAERGGPIAPLQVRQRPRRGRTPGSCRRSLVLPVVLRERRVRRVRSGT